MPYEKRIHWIVNLSPFSYPRESSFLSIPYTYTVALRPARAIMLLQWKPAQAHGKMYGKIHVYSQCTHTTLSLEPYYYSTVATHLIPSLFQVAAHTDDDG